MRTPTPTFEIRWGDQKTSLGYPPRATRKGSWREAIWPCVNFSSEQLNVRDRLYCLGVVDYDFIYDHSTQEKQLLCWYCAGNIFIKHVFCHWLISLFVSGRYPKNPTVCRAVARKKWGLRQYPWLNSPPSNLGSLWWLRLNKTLGSNLIWRKFRPEPLRPSRSRDRGDF